ncbi:hypothetical protein HY212_03470 [Candidatus Pacearchaeota archaeon]|nr:hypothetical protein [Candidatus Pacearchaeota archaeon]
MVKIENLINEGKISKISELEIERYVNFFENSYKNNLKHSKANLKSFPRWSTISGYYAMHDITKLLLAKKFRLKIEFEVHATTIKALKELIKNKEILTLIEKGYKAFISLANDLAEARKERVKVQYYTGTKFMHEEYKKRAEEFYKTIVLKYIGKIKELLK